MWQPRYTPLWKDRCSREGSTSPAGFVQPGNWGGAGHEPSSTFAECWKAALREPGIRHPPPSALASVS
eukprot:7384267-Prymnesium_polylepis.1